MFIFLIVLFLVYSLIYINLFKNILLFCLPFLSPCSLVCFGFFFFLLYSPVGSLLLSCFLICVLFLIGWYHFWFPLFTTRSLSYIFFSFLWTVLRVCVCAHLCFWHLSDFVFTIWDSFFVSCFVFCFVCVLWKWKSLSHVQFCVTPWNCSLPDSSVHRILQERILEWVAVLFSRGSSRPRDRTWVSYIEGEFFTIWATWEALCLFQSSLMP